MPRDFQYQATVQPLVLPGIDTRWFMPLSEPVQMRVMPTAQMAPDFVIGAVPIIPDQFYQPFQDPVWEKPGLRASLQQFLALDAELPPTPAEFLEGWYNWLSEPVRDKPGLKAALQQFFAYHPRVLPTPDVTMTMAATETNSDVFLGAVNVYGGGTTATGGGATVSVIESGPGGDPISIEES